MKITDVNSNELRYIAKAIRYQLGLRDTKNFGKNGRRISKGRRRELEQVANWILRGLK